MIKKSKILLISLLFIFISLTSVLAWFTFKQTANITLKPGDFEISIDAYLVNSNEEVVKTKEQFKSTYYDSNKDCFIIDGGSTTPENSIKNLRVDLKIKSKIRGKIRILIKDEWISKKDYKTGDRITTEIINLSNFYTTYFTILNEENFRYDSNTGYIYYLNDISKGETTINFISGGVLYSVRENAVYKESCIVNLNFDFEIVQSNRYKQFWNLDHIDSLNELDELIIKQKE